MIGISFQSISQTAADSAAIKEAVLGYIGGFYTGDGERMEKALYHDLAKRAIFPSQQGRDFVDDMTALGLIQYSREKGDDTPEHGELQCDIEILDIYGNVALAKSYTVYHPYPFMDYMQIGKINGEWKIVNVLWAIDRSKQEE